MKTYTINLITRDTNDLIVTAATKTVQGDFASALKTARSLSGGRKMQTAGVDTYVDGPRGRAWIVA